MPLLLSCLGKVTESFHHGVPEGAGKINRAVLEAIYCGIARNKLDVHSFVGCTLFASQKQETCEEAFGEAPLKWLINQEMIVECGDGHELKCTCKGSACVVSDRFSWPIELLHHICA